MHKLLDTMISDDNDGDELDDYVHLQDYTHSSIDVHIQGETTDDQDISFLFHSQRSRSLALQWLFVSAHAALEGLIFIASKKTL